MTNGSQGYINPTLLNDAKEIVVIDDRSRSSNGHPTKQVEPILVTEGGSISEDNAVQLFKH